MTDSTPFVFRWGIISTGWIAGCFVRVSLIKVMFATNTVAEHLRAWILAYHSYNRFA